MTQIIVNNNYQFKTFFTIIFQSTELRNLNKCQDDVEFIFCPGEICFGAQGVTEMP